MRSRHALAWALMAVPLGAQDGPRGEVALHLALATGDLKDSDRRALGYGFTLAWPLRSRGPWRFGPALDYTGFSRSLTRRPLPLRGPGGSTVFTEEREVTRNVMALGFQATWHLHGGATGAYLGGGLGWAHWYEIEHLAAVGTSDIQRRTNHLALGLRGGWDFRPGRTGASAFLEARATASPTFDGVQGRWTSLGAGLRF